MPERTVTAGQILTWAREVANDFVSGGRSMEDSAKKIATDHSLNEQQIARVCQAANHEVYKAEASSNPNRLFEFPVLRAEAVVEALNEPAKTAAVSLIDDSDYAAPPPLAISYEEALDRIFPKTAEDSQLVELRERQELIDLRIEINKLAAMEGEVRSRAVGMNRQREAHEQSFYEHVRNMLLEGQPFESIYEDLMIDRDSIDEQVASPEGVRNIMESVLERLKAENLVDEGQELPQETPRMISAKGIDTPQGDLKTASEVLTQAVACQGELRTLRHALETIGEELQEKRADYQGRIDL